jgi:4-amino-4-deoxy-L-arabinose transferase-like glycosyltransferase
MTRLRFLRNFWRTHAIEACGLIGALSVGAWLRFHALGELGLGNLFYASTVRSMGQSWRHFWFAAYDPAATLTVDKPPLALWIQVAAVRLLNFDAWGLIGPMALAGTVAIALTWGAARRSDSRVAALVAALALAVFPESVATGRDSTMDAMMAALLAGAAWLLIVAVESRRARYLVAWAVVMGLVFNVKFFEGFLVLPAAVLYLVLRWRREALERWRLLVGAAATLILVSAIWVIAVEVTPAERRPRIMNDQSNSAVGLVLRYNGIERVLPGEVTIFAPIPGASAATNASIRDSALAFGVGDAGPARLLTGSNGPLLGTTVLLALAGIALAARDPRRFVQSPALFWATWALTGIVLFSVSNRAAAQYTEAYAPALAVLVGLAAAEAARMPGRRGVAVCAVIVLGIAAYARWAVHDHPPLMHATTIAVVLVALAAALVVLAWSSRHAAGYRVLAFLALLAIPAAASIWITTEAPHGGQITRPNPLVYATRRPPLLGNPDRGTRYRFGIDGVNNTAEAVVYGAGSVLPVWNEYQRAGTLPPEELDALLASGEVPGVILGLSRLRGGLIGRDVMDAVQRRCRLDPSVRVGQEWSVWRCVP